MNSSSAPAKLDPHETPVWALYTCNDDAQIIHACLPRYRDTRENLPSRMWSDGGKWTSRSAWDETREGLIQRVGIMPSCRECHRPYSTSYVEPYKSQMIAANTCFHCTFWLERLAEQHQPGHLIINGTCYSFDIKRPILPEEAPNPYGSSRGFGGRRFKIRMLADGTIHETNNLWSQGTIPVRFRDRLPDNAAFEEYPKATGHGQGFLG